MAEHITIRPAKGTWVVRAGGAVLGESQSAKELTEGSYPAVIYIPREDLAMAFFEKTETTSTCPHKGEATYYSIIAKSGEIKDAAWSYEDPFEAIAGIKDHMGFYTNKVAVEEV